MQVTNLAEVIAVDGEGNRQREQPGAAEERPEEKFPVADAFFVDDSKLDNRAEEGQDVFEIKADLDLGDFVFLQEGLDTIRSRRRPRRRPTGMLREGKCPA